MMYVCTLEIEMLVVRKHRSLGESLPFFFHLLKGEEKPLHFLLNLEYVDKCCASLYPCCYRFLLLEKQA